MKNVSCRLFFSVMWKGICQAFAWFFGLFGYKREGKLAKAVWGVFAVSATLIVALYAVILTYEFCHRTYSKYFAAGEGSSDCYYTEYVSRNVELRYLEDEEYCVYNIADNRVTLRGVAWISRPLSNEDSLVVYSDGEKRGYFNKYTGDVVIEPRYSHAWVFSEGIASVEENGVVRFINQMGEPAFERTLPYHDGDNYVFHGGYCVIDNNGKYGLMNKRGETVLEEKYDNYNQSYDLNYWTLYEGDSVFVLNRDLQVVLPKMKASVWVCDDVIEVTTDENIIMRYDLNGKLIGDFYIKDFDRLTCENEFGTSDAKLCCYTAGRNMCGLMTHEGKIVTKPKYWTIEAIDEDTYLCTFQDETGEIVNGRGERVW